MKHRKKTCCHCGAETHPQYQDSNRDTGYGYCHKCIDSFYTLIKKLDYDTASFDIFEDKKDPTTQLLTKYQHGELQGYQMIHFNSIDEIVTRLSDRYSNMSTVIPS